MWLSSTCNIRPGTQRSGGVFVESINRSVSLALTVVSLSGSICIEFEVVYMRVPAAMLRMQYPSIDFRSGLLIIQRRRFAVSWFGPSNSYIYTDTQTFNERCVAVFHIHARLFIQTRFVDERSLHARTWVKVSLDNAGNGTGCARAIPSSEVFFFLPFFISVWGLGMFFSLLILDRTRRLVRAVDSVSWAIKNVSFKMSKLKVKVKVTIFYFEIFI